jgi:hypothetical protein
LQDGYGRVELAGEGADIGEDGHVLGRLAVREVEPGHVHPALEQGPELRPRRGRRADRADDLRLSLRAGDAGADRFSHFFSEVRRSPKTPTSWPREHNSVPPDTLTTIGDVS